MRQLIFALLVLAATPGLLAAQTDSTQASSAKSPAKSSSGQSTTDRQAYGYVFFAPGVVSGSSNTFLNFGGGGEGLIKGGLSLGGEISGFTPAQAVDQGIGILSADAGYHFLKASKSGKVVPFVNGGYSLFFRSGAASGVNFGGGVNYWFKERVGVRFEVRDHIIVEYPDTHYVGFRVGLTFR